MVKKIILAGRDLAVKLFTSLKRFPEAILLTAIVVMIQIFLHHLNRYADINTLRDVLIRTSMVLALGVPLLLSLKLLFERLTALGNLQKTLLYLGIIIGLVLYYFYWLQNLDMVPLSRYTAFTLGFYLVFLIIPYFYKRENFELYCVQLLTNFAVTYFYAVILYLGLSAILFTISKLFGVQLGPAYFDIWLIVTGIFAPAYFLADVPELKREFQSAAYPKVLKILLLYIVVPLLIAYGAILYAYFAKIIIARSWPEGIVAHLVLWYSLISCLVIFFIYPLRTSKGWIGRFLPLFPKFFFPLLAMMFVSMGIRIQNYGITENRYFVLIAGLWVAGILFYYLFSKKVSNIVLPISLALVAMFSVAGPWSSYSISKLSQNHRFAAILNKYDMILDNSIVKPEHPLPKAAKAEIISILSYFQRFHNLNELKYLPQGFQLSQTPKIFGFKVAKEDLNYHKIASFFHYDFPENQPVNIGGYDYFVNIPHSDITKITREKIQITYAIETGVFKVWRRGEEIYSRKVSDLIAPRISEATQPEKASLTFTDENHQLKVFFVCNNLSGQKNPVTEEIEINYLNFFVFIKLK